MKKPIRKINLIKTASINGNVVLLKKRYFKSWAHLARCLSVLIDTNYLTDKGKATAKGKQFLLSHKSIFFK